eukprot:12407951-Prorocentrum_lima.AAC.1
MALTPGGKQSSLPLSSNVQWRLAQATRVTHTHTFSLPHVMLKPPPLARWRLARGALLTGA